MVRRTFSALTLVAALGAAALVPAVALAQPGRIYDRSHRDYHQWNGDEDRLYRQYLADHHRRYRAFSRTTRQQQLEYWRWRHDHGGR